MTGSPFPVLVDLVKEQNAMIIQLLSLLKTNDKVKQDFIEKTNNLIQTTEEKMQTFMLI